MPKPDDNLTVPIPGGLLDRVVADWNAHGWKSDDLRKFRMEDPPAPPAPPAPTPPPPAGGLSQDEVNRIAAREKDEGKRAAEKAIEDLLGCTPAEAKAILDAKREEDKGKMTEADRKAAEATEAKAKADKAIAVATEREQAANNRQRTLDITDALIDADVRKDRRAAAVKLIDVPADADTKAITAAVEAFKNDYPEWFAGSTPPVPGGDPKGKPPRGQGGDESAEGAEDRYRKAREQNGKSSDPFAGMTRIGA